MIQSGIFDSSAMDIKNIANSIVNFVIKRLIEISGILVSILGLLLLLSLISYSPEDPNFIFPENTQIKNLLGFKGSLYFRSFFSIYRFDSLFDSFNVYFNRYKYF